MYQIYVILFTFISILFFNYIFKKKQFFVDRKFSPHKSFATDEFLPITGGLVFFLGCLFFLSFENNLIKLFILMIFIIGFLSDNNYLFSPIKRFFLQLIIIFLFVYVSQNFVSSLRFQWLIFCLTIFFLNIL